MEFYHPEHFEEFQVCIGYRFVNPRLLGEALTHKSFANEDSIEIRRDNERFEFLGDAVIQLFISDLLMQKYPDLAEGELSKFRAVLVSEKSLAEIARAINLGKYLYIGKGEESSGGREKSSILADALEAILAAVFWDSKDAYGISIVSKVAYSLFYAKVLKAELIFAYADRKTDLQELVQKRKLGVLRYDLIRSVGPDHDKDFYSRVMIDDDELGQGQGKTKKEAEQNAASAAIVKIRELHG